MASRTVLDIGTGGLALLAIFAAQSKARKVYAIEANRDAYEQVGHVQHVNKDAASECGAHAERRKISKSMIR